jgi:Raf kinase inhibitor-like YbhB/YbcL family protein
MSFEKCHTISRIWISAPMRPAAFIFLLAALYLLSGPVISALAGEAEDGGTMTMKLTSQAFSANDRIPKVYTCDGKDISPPLSWSGLPPGTRSLALILDDPDAPDPRAPQMTWVHWVIYNIPADINGLAENAGKSGLPFGTLEGTNDWNRTRYGGPCPPKGSHRYFFKLYALDTVLPDLDRPAKNKLLRAMQGHILAQTELIGTYKHRWWW